MRLAIITGTAILALNAGSALAQSADPGKRAQWEKSMSNCLASVDQREELTPSQWGKVCKDFADQEIADSYQNRLRALLASKETLAEPVTEEMLEHRAFVEEHEGSIYRGQLNWLEAHIRHTIIEECLVDPAGLSRDDCNRIGGLDRIREIGAGSEVTTANDLDEEGAK